jgi:hypothetical protein
MKRFRALALAMMLLAPRLPALDLWQYPESAEPGTIFIDLKPGAYSFTDGWETLPECGVDLVVPFVFPLSLGVFAQKPDPNLKSFGFRAGYHINPGDEKTDLYILYVFDLGFIRNDLLIEYNDTPRPRRYGDVRIGMRRRIGTYTALIIETTYKFQGVTAGISIIVGGTS